MNSDEWADEISNFSGAIIKICVGFFAALIIGSILIFAVLFIFLSIFGALTHNGASPSTNSTALYGCDDSFLNNPLAASFDAEYAKYQNCLTKQAIK